MVHASGIPRDLINSLKQMVGRDYYDFDKSEVENLFQPGDIVKVRVQKVLEDERKLDLVMTDPNFTYKERKPSNNGKYSDREENTRTGTAEVEEFERFDPDSTLLWWRGSHYRPAVSNRYVWQL